MLAAGVDTLKLFPAEAGSPGDAADDPRGAARRHTCDAGGRHRGCEHDGLARRRAAGFGIGLAIFRPGDSAEIVAQKAARLIAPPA